MFGGLCHQTKTCFQHLSCDIPATPVVSMQHIIHIRSTALSTAVPEHSDITIHAVISEYFGRVLQ